MMTLGFKGLSKTSP